MNTFAAGVVAVNVAAAALNACIVAYNIHKGERAGVSGLFFAGSLGMAVLIYLIHA